MKKLILLLSLTFVNTILADVHTSKKNTAVITETINGANVYGEKWQANKNSIDIEIALATHEKLKGEKMIFTGNITKVCQKAGCWMMLESNGQFARVDFNNHTFLVPKDARGNAEVYGVLHATTMSAEKKAHIESEGSGILPEKIFEISATSVKILP